MAPSDVQRLLRLKRFEQPPPGYFEDFAAAFRARQRAELLRAPVWRIAVDRFAAWLGEASLRRPAYGLGAAAVAVAGVMLSASFVARPPGSGAEGIAGAGAAVASARSVELAPSAQSLATANLATANSGEAGPLSFARLSALPEPAFGPGAVTSGGRRGGAAPQSPQQLRPHYVIDARPVSYEPTNSF